MSALIGTVFLASLLGSPHCAGMCGPLVAFYAGAGGISWRSHAAYHGGRLLVYLLLGVAAGGLGRALDAGAAWAGLGRAAALIASVYMVVWAMASLARAAGWRLPSLRLWRPPQVLRRVLGGLRAKPPEVRAVSVGLVSALLPCGWLYTFVVSAAGTGSVAGGAAVMGLFWLGNVPMLLGVGATTAGLLGRGRAWLPVGCALLVLVVGLLGIGQRLQHAAPSAAQGSCHEHR
jgi:sulfite exporter TauE/SafE